MDLEKKFAQNLIEQRESRGLTPEELARAAAIRLDHLESMEGGAEQPLMNALIQLATALDVPVDALLAGIRWVPNDGFSVADD